VHSRLWQVRAHTPVHLHRALTWLPCYLLQRGSFYLGVFDEKKRLRGCQTTEGH
jgi:hypothetical protein